MNSAPWKKWIPGALNDRQLTLLIKQGFIENAAGCGIDYSSFDLTLGKDFYEMIEGSVKPFGGRYEEFLKKQKKYSKMKHWEQNGEFVLMPGITYVFKLKERLSSELKGSPIHGQATAKSSIGRMDMLARLIVDGMHSYEGFDAEMWKHGNGTMFLEVTSMTFRVRVKPGISLSQLRLFYGKPEESEIKGEELYKAVMRRNDLKPVDEFLRVDVSNIAFKAKKAAAFKAKNQVKIPIKLWTKGAAGNKLKKAQPAAYWELENSVNKRFPVMANSFYILRSKEKIILPPGVCVYCRAIDETIGEMRIHYAGFVHPHFGYHIRGERHKRVVEIGTPLIFEVRGHDVHVVLNDDEPLARLQFYRMSRDCSETPNRKKLSAYHDQTLRLSQFFDQFPTLN
jgi:dCTP deaminase